MKQLRQTKNLRHSMHFAHLRHHRIKIMYAASIIELLLVFYGGQKLLLNRSGPSVLIAMVLSQYVTEDPWV